MSLKSGCLTIIIITGLIVWLAVKANNYAHSPEGRAAAAKRAEQAEIEKRADAIKAEADERARQAQADADRKASDDATKRRAEEEAKLRKEAPTFTASQVVGYYAANEVAGDEALKDKVFKVSGVVERVGKDLLNKSYVAMKPRDDSIRSVQCFFDDARKGELSSLRPGQKVVIYGKCTGLMMNVLMEECEIVK